MRTAISRGQWQPLIGAHQPGKPVRLMNGKTRVSKTPYCRGECKAVYQAPAPHNTCRSCWLGTAQQFYHGMRGEGGSRVTSKFLQEAHIHHPAAWPLPHACAQPNHEGSGSHGNGISVAQWPRKTRVFFCLSGASSHGPGSAMVGAMAERHHDTWLSRGAMALPSNAWRRVHQYAKIAQELNLAPRKRSPPNGAPEQSIKRNRRLFNCDNRRIETHQSLITSLHSI